MDVDMYCELFQKKMIQSPQNNSKENLNKQMLLNIDDHSKQSNEIVDINQKNTLSSLKKIKSQNAIYQQKKYFQNIMQIEKQNALKDKIIFKDNEINLLSLDSKIKLQQSIYNSLLSNYSPNVVQQINGQSIKQDDKQNDAKLNQIYKNNQISDDDNDDDEEEEFSIWNDDDLQNSGVNTDFFIDGQGNQLQFYQIYRLRSVLYQPQYVSRIDTIEEVQKMTSYFHKELSLNTLKQQQEYLDEFFDIQKKDNFRFLQKKQLTTRTNNTKKSRKYNNEKIQRSNTQSIDKNLITKQQNQDQYKNVDFNNLSFKKNQEYFSAQFQKGMKQQNKEVSSPLKRKQEFTNQKSQYVNKKVAKNQYNENKQKMKNGQTQSLNIIQLQKKNQIKSLKNNNQEDFSDNSLSQLNQDQDLQKRADKQECSISESINNLGCQKDKFINENFCKQSGIFQAAFSLVSYFKKIIHGNLKIS
ncbi:hypothetical protein ABPG73_000604 [Tetrahymena malaccensis]